MVPYAGAPHIVFIDLLAATPVWELGPAVASLADHGYQIGSALDFLTTGA